MILLEDTWLLTMHVKQAEAEKYTLNLDLLNISAQNQLPTWFKLGVPSEWNLKDHVLELIKEEGSASRVTVLNRRPEVENHIITISLHRLLEFKGEFFRYISWKDFKEDIIPTVTHMNRGPVSPLTHTTGTASRSTPCSIRILPPVSQDASPALTPLSGSMPGLHGFQA